MESNMDLINDMFSTELEYHTDIESGQTKSYYLGKMITFYQKYLLIIIMIVYKYFVKIFPH